MDETPHSLSVSKQHESTRLQFRSTGDFSVPHFACSSHENSVAQRVPATEEMWFGYPSRESGHSAASR